VITLSEKETESKSKAWKGICSPRCWKAKSDPKRCKCKCKGLHHGVGSGKYPNLEKELTSKVTTCICVWCNEPLKFDKEKGWVHQDGEVYKGNPDGTDNHCALPKLV
jgi:hypothetical protein